MKVVCLSDTHGFHREVDVPTGDVLIHAGDFCRRGELGEVREFRAWLDSLPHAHKVIVAGNHDWPFEKTPEAAQALMRGDGIHYLQDSGVTIDGVRFWGAPWTPRFYDWAFNLDPGFDILQKWDLIPKDTNVLVTHGPPRGVLDLNREMEQCGCEMLWGAVMLAVTDVDALRRDSVVQPQAGAALRAHIFGHIHEGYGYKAFSDSPMQFVNAAVCTRAYEPTNPVRVVEI